MSWKQFVAGYLTFSRKDRAGVLTLLILVLLAFGLPYLVSSPPAAPVILSDTILATADSLARRVPAQDDAGSDYRSFAFDAPQGKEPELNGALFPFDPNTLDAAGWRRLGLPDRTIRTIGNYRSKGGRFYRTEDLARIWGLPKGFYDRVKGYVRIPGRERFEKAERWADNQPPEQASVAPKRLLLDINTTDTAAWIALPGIGPKLAARIVNFRNGLGGFVSVDQVGTTFGLPDSTFQKIKPQLRISETAPATLNINTATKEQLSKHPYISWTLARSIVSYRDQHGPFTSIEDLRKIMILDEATWQKIRPYVRL